MPLMVKRVGSDWTWFTDYVFVTANYTVFTPPGRRVQVGMGIFTLGEPRGEKIAVSGKETVTVIGMGAIHIRTYDGMGDCEVALSEDSNVLVPILKAEF